MRIVSLSLKNYRSHPRTTVRFEDGVNLIYGAKGSGKTSLLYALAALCCARNVLTDARGSGFDDQILDGAKGFEIMAEVIHHEKQAVLYRSKKCEQPQVFSYGPNAWSQAGRFDDWLRDIGARQETLSAVLDIRPFLGRSAADRRSEVLHIIQPTDAEVIPPPDLLAPLQRLMNMEDQIPIRIGGNVVENIEHFHSRAFDLRAVSGRRMRMIHVPPEPDLSTDLADSALVDQELVDWRREMIALRERRARLEGWRRLKQAATATPDNKEHLQEQIQKLKLAIENEKTRRAAAEEEAMRLWRESLPVCPSCLQRLTGAPHEPAPQKQGVAQLLMLEAERDDLKDRLTVAIATERFKDFQEIATHEELTAKIGDYEAGIAKLETIRSTRDQLLRERTAYQAARQLLAEAEAEYTDLERLCEWLGSKGIRKELFERWAAPFIGLVNEALESFALTATLDLHGEFAVNGRPAIHLSEGEQFLFEVAYRLAIARSSGLNLLAIDAANRVDAHTAVLLSGILRRQDGIQTLITGLEPWRSVKCFEVVKNGQESVVEEKVISQYLEEDFR